MVFPKGTEMKSSVLQAPKSHLPQTGQEEPYKGYMIRQNGLDHLEND